MKKTNRRNHRQKAKPSFRALPSYRLHELSTLSERLIGTRYREKFGLRMMEVGILILVGGTGPLSFKTAYTKTNLEKSNASRITSQLLGKGLLEKREDPVDQRSFFLALTPAGEKLYRELYADAAARNKQWFAVLSRQRRETFLECLDSLKQHTRKLLQASGARRGNSTSQTRSQDATDFMPDQRIILDTTAASRLYDLLGAALGKELAAK